VNAGRGVDLPQEGVLSREPPYLCVVVSSFRVKARPCGGLRPANTPAQAKGSGPKVRVQ
jgi:hypothetical protein